MFILFREGVVPFRESLSWDGAHSMKKPKLIVFDMDGVLIDVSGSYREAVRKTVRLFFSGSKGAEKLPDPLFSLTELAKLKQTGGLNNDWDLTALTLHLLFALVRKPAGPLCDAEPSDAGEVIRRSDVSELAEFLRKGPCPLMTLLGLHGRRNDPFVAQCQQGDVCTGNRIKRIFQEIYLGRSLFPVHYREEPMFFHEEGLIHREKSLLDAALLQVLARDQILAIATGRPGSEAEFPLDRFGLRQYFDAVITLDDSTREEEKIFLERGERVSLKKPNPYMLDQIPKMIERSFGECYYLGDMPDDMQAARASQNGYRGVGVILGATEPENLRRELLQAGADFVVTNPGELLDLLD